jgi:hypothetical protein
MPVQVELPRSFFNAARRAVLIAIAGSLAGCASMYKESGEKFATAYDEASKTIKTNLDAHVRARRLLGVQRYLVSGEQNDNITANREASFARYVCAGEGDFSKQRSAMGVLGSYKKIIADISKSPDDSVAAYWSSIQKNQEGRAPLKPPAEKQGARAECVLTVTGLLQLNGLPLAPAAPESVSALAGAYDGIKAFAGALEGLLKNILKIADEAARAEALRNFVNQNKGMIKEIFAKDLSDAALEQAYKRRMAGALVEPYAHFLSIFAFDRNAPADKVKILKAATTAHELLEPFDALRKEAAPSEIAKAMAEAQEQLVKLAEGEISIKQAWAALGAIVQMLKDVEEAAGKFKKAKDDL